jgi:hypothetical protein
LIFEVRDHDEVDYVVDLDQVAAEFEQRRPTWLTSGLQVGPLTWRDAAEPWPQTLHTDRGQVSDPDSVGVRLDGPAESVLTIVVFRGGWADIDYLTVDGHIGAEAPDMPTASAAAAITDDITSRIWPPNRHGRAAFP